MKNPIKNSPTLILVLFGSWPKDTPIPWRKINNKKILILVMTKSNENSNQTDRGKLIMFNFQFS
jgi:hypothetical protein